MHLKEPLRGRMSSLWHFLFPSVDKGSDPVTSTSTLDKAARGAEGGLCIDSAGPLKESSGILPAQSEACRQSSPLQQSHCGCQHNGGTGKDVQANSCSDNKETRRASGLPPVPDTLTASHGRVLYASQKGTAAAYASQLAAAAASAGLCLTVTDIAHYEVEQMWTEQCITLVLSTYEDGTPPTAARCIVLLDELLTLAAAGAYIRLLIL